MQYAGSDEAEPEKCWVEDLCSDSPLKTARTTTAIAINCSSQCISAATWGKPHGRRTKGKMETKQTGFKTKEPEFSTRIIKLYALPDV